MMQARIEEWYRVHYNNGLPNVYLTNDQAKTAEVAFICDGDIETVKVSYTGEC